MEKRGRPGHPTVENLARPYRRNVSRVRFELSDGKRADRFLEELKRFEGEGDMPRLQIIRLPNDHTRGATRDKRTPSAYVAENDAALGRIIEGHQPFTVLGADGHIFVLEDDAQNGA